MHRPGGAGRAILVCAARAAFCAVLAVAVSDTAFAEIPFGRSKQDVDLDGVRLAFISYKPKGFQGGPLILSFHGSDRNPGEARNALIPLSRAVNALVVAPVFDAERFPRWAYQLGGIAERIEEDGAVRWIERPPEQWTGKIVFDLIARIRSDERCPDMPYVLVGHSAGAQFLSRLAAFTTTGAHRIVLANAGSYLLPDDSQPFPYGFGRTSVSGRRDGHLRRYLASPITIFVGTEDVQRWGLLASPGAESQGLSRYERGVSAYRSARKLAAERGWMTDWRFIDVPEAGHSSAAMYGSAEARDALFGEGGIPPRAHCAGPAQPVDHTGTAAPPVQNEAVVRR
jgi:hypothetical protein